VIRGVNYVPSNAVNATQMWLHPDGTPYSDDEAEVIRASTREA
jgi:hypothetical protein